jgi:hypothetical protein
MKKREKDQENGSPLLTNHSSVRLPTFPSLDRLPEWVKCAAELRLVAAVMLGVGSTRQPMEALYSVGRIIQFITVERINVCPPRTNSTISITFFHFPLKLKLKVWQSFCSAAKNRRTAASLSTRAKLDRILPRNTRSNHEPKLFRSDSGN